jgi:hypothetical protein
MGAKMNHTIRSNRHKAKIEVVFLGLSCGLAIYLNNTVAFWQFVSWLPHPFSEGIVGFINVSTSPIHPIEVYAQAEQLEFFTAWGFSSATLFTVYLLSVAFRLVFRGRTQNAP